MPCVAGGRLLQYDIQVLTTIFSRFSTFRRITLCQCFLRDDSFSSLAGCLLYQQQLELLDLRQNMLTPESIPGMLTLLRGVPSLRHLDLRDNMIGSDDNLRVFEQCLMQVDSFNGVPVRLITSNTEQAVRLGNLRIQTPETAIIGKALTVNRSMTQLSVAANDLSAEGAANIISALIGHPKLSVLDLRCACPCWMEYIAYVDAGNSRDQPFLAVVGFCVDSKNNMVQSEADLYICGLLEELVGKSKKLSVINVEGSAIPNETLLRLEDSLRVNRALRREEEHMLEFGNRQVNVSEKELQAMLTRLDPRADIPPAKLEAEDQRDMFCRFLDERFNAVPMHVPPLVNPNWAPTLEFDAAYAAETKMPRRKLVIEGSNYYFVPEGQSTDGR